MVDDGTDAPGVAALVDTLLELPVTPAVKALVAHRAKDTSFLRTAPPLVPIDAATCARLGAALDAVLEGSAGAPPACIVPTPRP
jgi:4-hydroxy-tetrahydrodipicolinate synthase